MSLEMVIRDVSETLQALLEPATETTVTVNYPKRLKQPTNHLLNLFLYQVQENPFTKNRPPLPHGPNEQRRAPLGFNFHYMLTPYAAENADDSYNEHLILGRAMRFFHDHPVLTGPDLRGSLQGTGEVLRIVLCPMNLEERTRIWNALQMSYRLSVCYEVRVALLDSQDVREISRVTTQETIYAEL